MNRQEFNEKIQKEYETFMDETLDLFPEEIFEKALEISIKTFLCNYLQDTETLDEKSQKIISKSSENILDEIFNIFVENDPEFYYLDICEDIISDYLSLLEDKENEFELD